jgi:uncharacterized membrane protein
VVTKRADGTADVRQYDDFGPVGSLVGTSVGGLVGLLGGPVGVAIGATSGLVLGSIADIGNARVGEDFVADVSKTLTPNKVAVIAEVEEGWTTPVDTRMEAMGGTVLRRALWEVEDKIHDERVAAMKADVAQFKEEMTKAHEKRKATLKAKIEQLEGRIDAQVKKIMADHEAFKLRQQAKRELLNELVARLDVLREPDFAESLDGRHLERHCLLCLFDGGDIDAALDLVSISPSLFARILQRQLGVAPEHLLARSPVDAKAQDPRGLARSRRHRTRDEGQAFAHSAINRTRSEPCLQLAVGDRSVQSVHPILSFEVVGFEVGKPREKRQAPSEPHNKPHRVRALRCNAVGRPGTKRPYATTG